MSIPLAYDKIGLSFFQRLSDIWSSTRANSYSEYVKGGRIEPITIIDSSLQHTEYIEPILLSMQSIFAAYFLQAVSFSMNVGKVNVKRELDKLNPNRDPMDSATDTLGYALNLENYKNKLPSFKKLNYASEASDGKIETEVLYARDTTKGVAEDTNLSVGKLFEINVGDGEHMAPVVVAVRLLTYIIESSVLVSALSVDDQRNVKLSERVHLFKAKAISISDLILCNDIIDEYRAGLMKDKTGVMDEIRARKDRNKLAAILSLNPSIGTASNIAVISKETKIDLEKKMHERFDNASSRAKLFDKTSLMILCVVDQDLEQVVMYVRGIALPTKMSIKSMKNVSKGNGPDVSTIMKSLLEGKPPIF